MIQEYILRQQLQNRGAFCSISFDIISNSRNTASLEIIYEADNRWKTACEAGILIFYDYYRRSKDGSLTIKIIGIEWMPVDTNNLIVLYATVKGLCELLNLPIASLNLDVDYEAFIFPECRKK